MRLLWSGRDSSGTILLKESPDKYRVLHCTNSYEEGRVNQQIVIPAACGLEEPNWYITIGISNQLLTFHEENHTLVKIHDYGDGQVEWFLKFIYGQE